MMAADFKENGNVELITEMPSELYALLVKHAKNARLTVDGAVQQILSVALEHDSPTFERLAEADRLREEAEAKAEELKAKLEEALNEAARLRRPYTGGDDRIYAIVARHKAATEGPWWSDENEWCYRLHGVMARIPASEHIGEQIMNKQILKAEKQGQSYQEYWPDAGDAAFIENAWADIGYLMWRVGRTEAQVNFLLKMPKRIWSSIGLACTASEHGTPFCECEQAAKVALDVGRIMRDELRTMDEIVPVEPTPEPS